jgi:hypothetical protein
VGGREISLRRVVRISLPILGLLTYGWLTLMGVLVALDYFLGIVVGGEVSLLHSALRIAAASLLLAAWLYSWWMLALYLRRRLQRR